MRLALLAAVAGSAALPAGALAAPPRNDGYLQSIAINARGSTLTQETVKDVENTREATVQPDLFSPPGGGGGAERTDCRGTVFGATAWYDFHPHADGTVRVQATGYDAALGVYEFDPMSSRIGDRLDCANEPGGSEELFVKVKRGKSYTVQVGGSDGGPGRGPATGDLDFTFEYLSDTDGDGTLDALDKCPDQPGTSSGCPQELVAVPRLQAIATAGGIRVSRLSVKAPGGASVKVRCRRGCSFNQTRKARAGRAVAVSGLRNRQLPVGARLEIFVTKAQSIGSYTRYVITRGNFKRTTRCLRPGSLTPRRSCT